MNYINNVFKDVPTSLACGVVGGAIVGSLVGGPVGGAVGLMKMGGAVSVANRLILNLTTEGPFKTTNYTAREIANTIRIAGSVLALVGAVFYFGAAPATFAATAIVFTAVALAPQVGKLYVLPLCYLFGVK